jgi:hypothetical protein
MRYILRSVSVMNLILLAAILLCLNYALLPLFGKDAGVSVTARKAETQKMSEQKTAAEGPAISTDYMVIADRNLFHPDRTIPVEKKDEKPLPKPEFVLFGTLIENDRKIAFMDDTKATEYSTAGRGKRQHVLSIGNNLSGYVLSEIYEDRVVMARGEDKITVRIDDRQFKRSGQAETTVSPAPAAGPRAPAASRARPRPAQPAQPVQQPAAPAQAQPYRQFQPQNLRQGVRSIKPQPPRTVPQPSPDDDDDDE